MLNRFTIMPGVPVQEQLNKQADAYPHIAVANLDVDYTVVPHRNQRLAKTRNLMAAYRLIRATNQINRKPLLEKASEFEGAF